MTIARGAKNIALAANTHGVAYTGLGSALVGFGALDHLATTIAGADSFARGAIILSAVAFLVAVIATLYGRTPVIPDDPDLTSPVAADVPRPSTAHVAAALAIFAGAAGGRSLGMNFAGKLADGVVAFYDANKPALIALLQTQNVPVVAWVENAAAALLAKNPMLQLVLGGEVKGLAPQLITFFGNEENAAVAALDAILHAEATKLGG